MDKGSTTLGNVALLKYALENGIFVAWNLLAGFPGERDEWYAEMADWLPLLTHLQAPSSMITIRYDRFSEYWEQKDRYDLDLVPFDAYSYVYPLGAEDLAGLAYFFEDRKTGLNTLRTRGPGTQRMEQAIRDWRKLRRPRVDGTGGPVLMLHEEAERSIIVDTRPCAYSERTVLEGLEHAVHHACRRPRPRTALVQELRGTSGVAVTDAVVGSVIDGLIARKLLMQVGERVMALATREPLRPFVPMTEFPAGFNYGLARRSAAMQKQMMLVMAEALGA
jgi:magnesium-protoporphyrin IX monomethyl ester (oxidative) cyclase